MRVGAEPAVPGPVSSGGHAGRPTGDDNTDAGFDHLLRQAEKEPPAKGQSATGTAPRQPLWPDFAARLADKATKAGVSDDTDKPSEDDSRIGDGKAKRNDKHPQAQDQAPLLAVLPGNLAAADGKDSKAVLAAANGNTPAGSPMNGATRAEAGAKISDMDQQTSVEASLSAAKGSVVDAAQAGKPKATPASPGSAGQADGASAPGSAEADANNDDSSSKPVPATRAKEENSPQIPAGRHSGSDKQAAAHVTVTAEQHFPAPPAHPASQTATSLASAIATDSGVRQALSPSAGSIQPAAPVAVASHMLKIELHPAELGMVTANLRLAGGQLSIELTPENHEAHRKLSSDTDSLVKSLQAMGFTVDKVTVLQPSVALSAASRPDAATPSGRDSSSFQPGNSGGNGEPSGGQQSGRNHGNGSQHDGHGIPHPGQRAGGDLFI